MAVGCLAQKCSAARRLQTLTSIFATRLRLWNAGHSPTAATHWIFSGASTRAADEVIEYGTRTSGIGTNRTYGVGPTMSVPQGRPEVIGGV